MFQTASDSLVAFLYWGKRNEDLLLLYLVLKGPSVIPMYEEVSFSAVIVVL